MRLKRDNPVLPILVAITLLLPVRSLIACDCIMYPIEKYIDTSEYIAIGRVVKLIDSNGRDSVGFKVVLSVNKVYKGQIEKAGQLSFDSDSSDCAFKFHVDRKYLLFFCKRGDKFYVYHCSYSDDLEDSKKNISKIKKYMRKTSRLKKHSRPPTVG